jgi:hypothetical protein
MSKMSANLQQGRNGVSGHATVSIRNQVLQVNVARSNTLRVSKSERGQRSGCSELESGSRRRKEHLKNCSIVNNLLSFSHDVQHNVPEMALDSC